jgi:RHS repeat-associated protein
LNHNQTKYCIHDRITLDSAMNKRLFRFLRSWMPFRTVVRPQGNTRRVGLLVTLLEDRVVPTLITWDGGGGDGLWANALNWSGDVLPGTNDDAVIDVFGQAVSVAISDSRSVNSLTSQGDVLITGSGAGLTVSALSVISGSFFVTNGASLTASGSQAILTANGNTSVNGGSLYALGGGRLNLPALTSYALTERGVRTLQADGAGSVLDLSHVGTLTGITLDGGFRSLDAIEVRATNGGVVDLSGATQIVDPAQGDGVGRRYVISATGAGSRVKLPLLTALLDRNGSFIDASDLGQGVSVVEVSGGGTVDVPLLASLSFTNLVLADASSVLPVTQFTSITNGSITASGAGNDRTFDALTDVTGTSITSGGVTVALPALTEAHSTSFHALGGGRLNLPALTSYALTERGVRTLQADGAGSVLDLSHVGTLTGITLDGGFRSLDAIEVRATNGGVVDLSGATQIVDPAQGDGVGRRYVISATGAGSRVKLPLLTALLDRNGSFIDASDLGQGVSVVEVSGGGTVDVPLLASLSFTNLVLADASSVLPVTQFTSITNGSITASGAGNDRTFDALTDVMGTSIAVSGASALHLPYITAVVFSSASQIWRTSTGGVLDLPLLKSVTMSAGELDLFTFLVVDSLAWTGGTLSGGGTLRINTGGSGTISGSAVKILGLTLENAGNLTYSGSGLAFGLTDHPGTVTNLAGKTLAFVGDGDIAVNVANPSNGIANAGTLVRYGTGTTRIDVPVVNTGSVVVQQGSLDLASGSPLGFPDPSFVTLLAGTTLRLSGSVVGSTNNTDLFSAVGTFTFTGGTLAAPRTLEVMGADRGPTSGGYVRNFAFGTLSLDSAYLKLVDAANNAAGSGAEAVYVDTLIVPTGSVLDLNGFKLYARTLQVAGTVIGGTVTPMADGGSLALNAPTFGSISSPGEVDDWGFYGRVGQRISLTVNPGSGGSPDPVAPVLEFAEIQLLSVSGDVLANAFNTVSGALVTLTFDSLPAAGNYTIRIKAGPAHPSNTGNYLLAGYDATVDTTPLVLNQQVIGLLENTRSVDRWTFSGSANQQVRFDFANAAFPGVRFSLTGPNGWTGFIDLAGDSDLVTLPAGGNYRVEATSNGAGYGSYAFRLEQTSQTPLTLGTSFAGTFTGAGFAQLFSTDVPSGTPLNLVLGSAAAAEAEVYLKFGAAPTRRSFDYQGGSFGGIQSVLVPFALPGRWYVLVYSQSIPAGTAFTLRADATPVLVSSVSPTAAANNRSVMMTIRGAGFLPGSTVELVGANGTPTAAQTVGIDSTTQLTATFLLAGLAAGPYDVRVTLPGGAITTKVGAFEVLPAGAAKLETRLILPPAFGRHATATMYVEYANTGSAAMSAPLLTLQSADPDGSDRPFLTLDATKLVEGFWTNALPEGFFQYVQIYASGATPGVLQPGERIQVPVYYAGLQTPWDLSDEQIELEVKVTDADDTSPIDWAGMQASLRPTWIPADAWPAVYANLQAQIGPTWGDYIHTLNEDSTYLARLGETVIDVTQLYNYELQQAVGYRPVDTLASATDAAMPGTGFALSYGRKYGTNLIQRYDIGVFGRGWIAPWQTSLTTENGGIVVISDTAGSQRRFQPDSRRVGQYFSAEGDTGTLRQLPGGAYEITETSGDLTRFRADGTLEFIQDPNGNRITTSYTAGRLTSLTHSSGAALALTYNSAGRVVNITDSAGRVTTYGYDPTNNYLLTVTTIQGTTTYTYSTSGPVATLHALTSVTDPSGVTQSFAYDSQGRLSATYTGTNVNRVTFGYDTAGTISTTDPAGALSQIFVDHRGLVVRQTASTGYYVNYTYADRRLSQATDTLGRTQTYTRTAGGALASTTDALGHTTTFLPGGPNDQPSTFIDANSNTTRYAYDASGNLTRTTYADGSAERVSYDARGNAIEMVNRRGNAIAFTYNSAGQLTSEAFPDGTSYVYAYDPRGRLMTATDPRGTTTFTYDTADRLTRIDYPQSRSLAYQYDAAGRRTRMTDDGGFVTRYVYDAVGRPSELRDAADALIVRYTYDSAGRLSREEKGNGTFTVTSYDANSRVTSIFNFAPGGSANSKFLYTYDLLNRRTAMTTIDGTWTYTYDLTGQLTRAVFASTNLAISNQDLNYVYDALGNRIRTILNGVSSDYTRNNLNQYTAAGATTYQYDRDGNLTSETGPTGTTNYTYDAQSRLVRVVTPTTTTQYEYNALGHRTAVVTNGVRTQFVWDPFGLSNVAAEYDAAGGRTVSYSHGLGLEAMTTGGGRAYFDFDSIGSTAGISANSGTYSNRYAYEPFGGSLLRNEILSNSFEYVGGLGVMNDGDDRLFMRAREYQVRIGMFGSQDPLRLLGGSISLYQYASNDPVRYLDPSGLLVIDFGVSGGAGIGGTGGIQFDTSGGISIYAGPGATTPGVGGSVTFGPGTVSGTGLSTQVQGAVGPGYVGVAGSGSIDENGNTNFGIGGGVGLVGSRVLGIGGFVLGNIQIRGVSNSIPYRQQPGRMDGPSFYDYQYGPLGVPLRNPTGRSGSGGSSAVGTPVDPNEKLGANGYGAAYFIAGNSLIPYRINFENLGAGSIPTPTQPATAPAQQVVITDQLSDKLDWTTFQFTEYGYGDTVVNLASNGISSATSSAFRTLPLTYNGQTFTVEVDLSFDQTTGQIRVVFQSLDPNTGLPPDVLTGFLPPEDGSGRGKGHVAYTVRAKSGLPTSTQIRNIALITFDGQTAIATNQVAPLDPSQGTDPTKEALNTIDADTPTARVTALPAVTTTTNFVVSWTGNDVGAGVVSYDVYVSADGGSFQLWLGRTAASSATYSGQGGRSYSFYAVATDGVGLTESGPGVGEASTVVQLPVSPPPPTVPPTPPPTVPPTPPPTVPPTPPPSVRVFAVGSAAGSGQVRLYNADRSERFTATPFGEGFAGGIRTATADFNGDGIPDLVAGTGPGWATQVVILDGVTQTLLFAIDPFEAAFTGGVYVAVGDINRDGKPDLVVTPDEGGGPRVRAFSGVGFVQLADFFGIEDTSFRGGARAALGDITGDGFSDLIVVAGFGGGPRVSVWDGASLADGKWWRKPIGDFFAFELALRNGVFVAAGDVDGDGYADLVASGGPGGGPRVSVFDGRQLSESGTQIRKADFFAGDIGNRGGTPVVARDLDGDGFADLLAGAGAGAGSRVTAYTGPALNGGRPQEWFGLDVFQDFTGGVYVG